MSNTVSNIQPKSVGRGDADAATPDGALFEPVGPRTIVDDVHGQLRRAILFGQLKPGEWLTQEDLAATFGVSRMPIRDALRTLSTEGLVEMIPHRGARVSPLTVEEFQELYAVRIGLEGLAVRLAAQQMTPDVLEQMARNLAELERLSDSTHLEEYLAVQAEYRQICYSVTGRERLCRNVADLRERAERYLRVVVNHPNRIEASLGFQRALFEACAKGDGAMAETALRNALGWMVDHAMPLLERLAAQEAEAVGGQSRRGDARTEARGTE